MDGRCIRCCDHLAAFIEASLSIRQGIRSRHLLEGAERLYALYAGKKGHGVDYGKLYDEFIPLEVKEKLQEGSHHER
jgi:putative hydrolase of HD superfamily